MVGYSLIFPPSSLITLSKDTKPTEKKSLLLILGGFYPQYRLYCPCKGKPCYHFMFASLLKLQPLDLCGIYGAIKSLFFERNSYLDP